MPNFWKAVNQVLTRSDLIIEVLDARMIEQTRNRELEHKIGKFGKKLLFVLNKCDLVKKELLEKSKQELQPSVFISSTEKLGTTILKKKILEISHGEPITVGIVGYPNVGKSSLINALAGRKAARTSAVSGFTRGLQKIRVDKKILLLDTPGVFPYQEKDEEKHAFTGAKDYAKIKDPEVEALRFIEKEKKMILRHYGVDGDDPEEILEAIGRKYQRLQKGGLVDVETTARMIFKDWQTGKMTKHL
ncbi:50S ribosome-binding GTPase [Candidatus Woesearchaeota archaeon]|nr:50S ribosome-binding GTPase [Candidatus Woesearchaeota archaeon]